MQQTALPAAVDADSLPDERSEPFREMRGLRSGARLSVTQISREQGDWVLDPLSGNFMAAGTDAPVPLLRIMEALHRGWRRGRYRTPDGRRRSAQVACL
jgi:hypothetical protein